MQQLFQYVIGFNAQPAVAHLDLAVPIAQVIAGTGKGMPIITAGMSHRFHGTGHLQHLAAVGF